MAHIGVSVDDDTKADWDEYVEESEYGSMSELVRTAVRKEIRRGDTDDSVPRELERELTQMSETQQALQRHMENLSDGFEDVADSATGSQYPEEIVELAHDIAPDLEEVSADHFENTTEQARDELRALADDHLDNPERIGEVHDALQYLEENLSYIESIPQGPSDYYRVRGRY